MIAAVIAIALQAGTVAPPPARSPDITVTARREKQRVFSLIRSLVARVNGVQYARFETEICPGGVGVGAAEARKEREA